MSVRGCVPPVMRPVPVSLRPTSKYEQSSGDFSNRPSSSKANMTLWVNTTTCCWALRATESGDDVLEPLIVEAVHWIVEDQRRDARPERCLGQEVGQSDHSLLTLGEDLAQPVLWNQRLASGSPSLPAWELKRDRWRRQSRRLLHGSGPRSRG